MNLKEIENKIKERLESKESLLDDENEDFVRMGFMIEYDLMEDEESVCERVADLLRDVYEEVRDYCELDGVYKVVDRDWDWGNVGEVFLNIYLEKR